MLSSAGNSINTSTNYTSLNSQNPLSAEEMFKKLSSNGSVVDANFHKSSSNNSNSSSNALKISTKGDDNNNDSENTDSQTLTAVKSGSNDNNVSYLYPKPKNNDDITIDYGNNSDDDEELFSKQKTDNITTSFASLAAAVGSNGPKVTKEQLTSYLKSLMSNPSEDSDVTEITFLKNLIAQFDSLSNGSDFITSLQGANEAQDYSTVTSEQVTSPIDIRV